jgi:ankyrin repeat protein
MLLLLTHGADVNAQANDCVTALLIAAYWSKSEVVPLLLAHSADVNAQMDDCLLLQ